MGERQRLSDVLKLKGATKWGFIERVGSGRDSARFEPISMRNKTDAASITQLAKLVIAEQKKANHKHVIALARSIRRCFLDDENVFRALVGGGLDKAILEAISDLRKTATNVGIGGHAPDLRALLASIPEMFEWDFFGGKSYKLFLEELLAVVTGCNDCDDSLFAEAASVVMVMCTTNIGSVQACLVQSTTCASMLEKAARDLPRAKSFYYEALLLELVYRLLRHTKKHGDDKSSRVVAKLVDAFPAQIASTLPHISPKAFRDETRRILNDFNAEVGVIKFFQLKGVQCLSSSQLKLSVTPSGWIDLGGALLEIETMIVIGGQEVVGTIKLPYKQIHSVKSAKGSHQIVVMTNKTVRLSDILDGLNESELLYSDSVQLRLSLAEEMCADVVEIISKRRNHRVADEDIVVVSAMMGRATNEDRKEAQSGSTNRQQTRSDKNVRLHNTEKMQKKPTSHATMPNRRRDSTDASGDGTLDASKSDKDTASTTRVVDPDDQRLLNCSGSLQGDLHCRDQGGGLQKNKAQTPVVDTIPNLAKVFTKDHEEADQAVVVPNEGDFGDEDTLDDEDWQSSVRGIKGAHKQDFRARQTHQLHKLQSLIQDILQTNNQYRQFSVQSLCQEQTVETDLQLKRKREHRESVDEFEHTNSAIVRSKVKRSDRLSHQNDLQHKMNEAAAIASSVSAKVSARTEELLMNIQTIVGSESRQNLDRVQKKLRAHSADKVAQTREKLGAIERTFNTDDLQVVQQMLQRI